MSFIGVISKRQQFSNIKNIMKKNMNKNEITLININKKSIENLKNVKCEVVIIFDCLDKLEENNLEEICKNAEYIIINSDMKLKNKTLENVKSKVITFGLNQKSTVTFSSITDENILISIQRNFINIKQKLVEVGEYTLKINKEQRTFLYEILASFIIQQLYFMENND